MEVRVTLDLSDIQAWLLAFFLAEVTYEDVYAKTDPKLPPVERESNARATLRTLNCIVSQLIQQEYDRARR